MKRITLAAIAAGAVFLGASAGAQNQVKLDLSDPITVRQHIMKMVGGNMKMLGAMAKGEAPYDARVAEAAFRGIRAGAIGFAAQFPPGSEKGHDTTARDTIWSDRVGFEEKVVGLIRASGKAMRAKPATLDEFRPLLGEVGGACKACHEGYRVKKQ